MHLFFSQVLEARERGYGLRAAEARAGLAGGGARGAAAASSGSSVRTAPKTAAAALSTSGAAQESAPSEESSAADTGVGGQAQVDLDLHMYSRSSRC